MSWKNSPPAFSTATETSVDLANQRLTLNQSRPSRPLDDLAHTIASPPEPLPPSVPSKTPAAVPVPTHRDPALPVQDQPFSYVDVFVDDFVGLCQGKQNQRRVRRTLLQAIDQVFCPLSPADHSTRWEPVSLKKLRKCDCSWGTIKLVLGWIIDTSIMTIHLLQHRQERLTEILASIPPTQKRIGIKKWHKILGELRSMSFALPGSRFLFSQMRHALTTRNGGSRDALNKGVH